MKALIVLILIGLSLIAASRGQTGRGPLQISLATDISGPTRYNPDGVQCYGEDNSQFRAWQGYMTAGQVFEVSVPFCQLNAIGGSGPGGATFKMYSKVPQKFPQLHLEAVSPRGNVFLAHDFGIVNRQWTLDRCFSGISNPNKYNIYDNDLGVWNVRLENLSNVTVKDVYFEVNVFQEYIQTQQDICPEQDWNLNP